MTFLFSITIQYLTHMSAHFTRLTRAMTHEPRSVRRRTQSSSRQDKIKGQG